PARRFLGGFLPGAGGRFLLVAAACRQFVLLAQALGLFDARAFERGLTFGFFKGHPLGLGGIDLGGASGLGRGVGGGDGLARLLRFLVSRGGTLVLLTDDCAGALRRALVLGARRDLLEL